MPTLLQLAQSYSDPDSVTYKLAYLREQVEQQLLSLGDLAYADQVQLAMLGETIIVGGYLKTELIDAKALHIGDSETNVYVSKDGIAVQNGTITIKDTNNRAVITPDGLKMMYVFSSSGELEGWQKCGIWDEWGLISKRACTHTIYLPSNLLIESGTLYARSMPSYRVGWAGIPDGFYHPRNLRLYKSNTAEDGFLGFPVNSEYNILFGEGGRTDITSSVWGSAWTPSGQGIKEKSGNITSHLTAGQANTFIVETSDSVTQGNERYMGAMQLVIVVEGFLRG